MAVIKIVPMPGAEGQKGDTGATGAQGPQGPVGATGPAGADAAWYYNGAYNPGASYVVGDVVTFEGQTWYRKNANGGNVGDTPSVGPFWDLVAAKGSDVSLVGTVFSSGSWNSRFYEENGIIPNLSGSVAPGFLNGRTQLDHPIISNYYTIGDMVFWNLNVYLIDAIQWGAITLNTVPGGVDYYRQWRFYLPFKHDANFYNWTIDGLQSGGSAVPFVGRAYIRNDYEPNIAEEEAFLMPVYGALVLDPATNESYVALSYTKDSEDEHSDLDTFHPINAQDPTNLVYDGESVPQWRQIRLAISGSYKKES